MVKVRKEAKVLSVPDEEIGRYIKMGFSKVEENKAIPTEKEEPKKQTKKSAKKEESSEDYLKPMEGE